MLDKKYLAQYGTYHKVDMNLPIHYELHPNEGYIYNPRPLPHRYQLAYYQADDIYYYDNYDMNLHDNYERSEVGIIDGLNTDNVILLVTGFIVGCFVANWKANVKLQTDKDHDVHCL